VVGRRSGCEENAASDDARDLGNAHRSTTVPTPSNHDLLTANEAIEVLDVKRPTLYTYVSRGWVRSFPSSNGRGRLYVREDLERLKSRSHGHGNQATTTVTLGPGIPSFETSLTKIDAGGPIYRGHSATSLARSGACFESVAELLWTGDLPEECPRWKKHPTCDDHLRDLELAIDFAKVCAQHVKSDAAPSLMAVRLGITAISVQRRARTASVRRNDLNEARELLLLSAALSVICTFGDSPCPARPPSACSIAMRLASAWKSTSTRIEHSRRARAIDHALVLAADDGLDKLAVAVRMMAVAGGDLYACISAGLDALAGLEYEGTCMQLEHAVSDLVSPAAVRRYVAVNADQGRPMPGFGHPRYPAGDPRTTTLLELAAALAPDERRIRNVLALIDAARDQGAPTFEVGLVAIAMALDLPFGSAATLVVLGRMAGFIAHVFEQWGTARKGDDVSCSERSGVIHRSR